MDNNPYRKMYTKWGLKELKKWMDKALAHPRVQQNIKDVENLLKKYHDTNKQDGLK